MRQVLALRLVCLTLVWLSLASPARAQTSSQTGGRPPQTLVEIHRTDGSSLIGHLERETADAITIRTLDSAVVTILRADVTAIAPAEGRLVEGEFWRTDVRGTRFFFGPTARTLPRGVVYVAFNEFLLPTVQVGVTDRLMVGGGTFVTFGSDGFTPVVLNGKVRLFDESSTTAAVSVTHFQTRRDGSAGLICAVLTRGSDDSAVTLGGGWGYARFEGEVGRSPALIVGAEHRVSRRVKVMTENYLFRGGGFISGGVRLLSRRVSADLGVLAPVFIGEFGTLAPIVNVVWTIDRR